MRIGSLGTIWAEIGLNTRKFDEGIMAAQLKIAKADGSMTSFGQKWTNQSTHMLTAGGLMVGAVGAVGVATVKMAADFEKSMRNVNSISKLSETQFTSLSKEVLQLSTKMPQSAKTLADGLYDISSSGFQGAEAMKVLTASAKAASAGMTTTAVSAKGVTAVLNAYGWEADKAAEVSDTMFKTVDKGVITFEELSSTVGDWVGMAKAANISFNEASGAIAYMTTKGISASEAGVSLSRMLTGIIKPSDEMAKAIHDAGYESGEAMLKTEGLTGTMKILNDTTGGSITKLIELIPEIRGVRGANALLGAGYEELTGYMADFNDTAGATDAALKEQSKSLDYQLQLLKNNVSAIGIELGSKYIPKLSSVTKTLTEFISTHQDATVAAINFGLGAVGIIGGLLLLAGTIGKVRAAVTLLNTTMLANPIFLAGASVASTVFLTGDSIQKFGDKTEEAQKQIKDFSDSIAISEQTLRKGKNAQDDFTTATQTLFKEITKTPELFDELNPKIVEINKNFADGKITQDQARDSIIELSNWYKNMPETLSTYNKYMQEGTASTIEQKVANIDNETTLQNLMSQYGFTREEAEEYYESTQEGTDVVDDQTESLKDLLDQLYNLYNLNQSVTEATWDFEDALTNYNKTMSDKSATDRDQQKALFDVQDALEGLQTKLLEGMESTEMSRQKQYELQVAFVDSGIKAVELGIITKDEFIKMAEQTGVSTHLMESSLQKLSGEVDATKGHFASLRDYIDTMQKEITIKVNMDVPDFVGKRGLSDGGIVGFKQGGMVSMAMGGIAGEGFNMPMPTAASGLITPQTGHKIPVMAEEGELILNSSQQNNVAQAIFGVANGQKAGGGVNIENFNVITPTGSPAEIARESRLQLRLMGMEASLS